MTAALQNNFFNFDDKIFKQIDEIAMGLPLGSSLANVFLSFHEQMGQSIQEWSKKDLLKTAFKKFEGIWSALSLQIC